MLIEMAAAPPRVADLFLSLVYQQVRPPPPTPLPLIKGGKSLTKGSIGYVNLCCSTNHHHPVVTFSMTDFSQKKWETFTTADCCPALEGE